MSPRAAWRLESLGFTEVYDYVDGKADPSEMLGRGQVQIEDKEELGHGTIKRDDLTLHYIAHRGTIRVHGDRVTGISTLLYIECPGDEKFRMGIWFGPDTGSGEAGEGEGEEKHGGAGLAGGGKEREKEQGGSANRYAGTPADESAIREFMSHFAPCGH